MRVPPASQGRITLEPGPQAALARALGNDGVPPVEGSPSAAEPDDLARPQRLDGLTVLRAVAAIAVVLFHFNQRVVNGTDLPHYLPFVDRYYLGVDLFFILSGFILAHVHGSDFARLTPSRAARFYVLRLARIYPVHVAMLAIYLVLFLAYALVGRHFGIGIRLPQRYSAHAFFAQLFLVEPDALTWNFPAWSVSAEWFAYLWFPVLAWLLLRAPARWCLLCLAGVVGGFALVYWLRFDGDMDRIGLVRVSFEFTAGYLLYRTSFAAPLRALLTGLALALVLAAAMMATRFADFGCVLLIGALVAVVARGSRSPSRRRVPRLLLWLGDISYSLYMVQSLIIAAAGRIALTEMARLRLPMPAAALALVPILLLAAILAAALLYRLVERPARDWLRFWLMRTARATRDRFRAGDIYEPSR